ncbi:hypothetical protein hbim_07136 [Mycolicibacterium mageritense]|uniref:Head-to-tail stopper n=2 Tax=Mycolicibacterium mageritense TaxID=53462 RepID=A0AAI8XSG2_MYCME|nr:hypothetical protein hbim_07136 [Mycolicibacterium mageritense]
MIEIVDGETVSVKRVTRTGSSESSVDMPDIEDTAFGSASVSQDDDMRGRRTIIERSWFCDRGTDIEAGDRITRGNGEVYSVIEGPFADTDHPLTGDDLGVKWYRVRRVNSPRG